MTDFKPNFSKAYIAANELLVSGEGIDSFPFSIKDCIIKNTDINTCSYNKAKNKYGIDISVWGSESAIIQEYQGQSIIFYNSNNSKPHVVFSMAHELGHHQLDHCANLEIDDPLYKKQEIEANYFAAQLLMPDQIINVMKYRGKKITISFLKETFGVSDEAAKRRIEALSKLNSAFKKKEEKEYDDIIELRYKGFVDAIAPEEESFCSLEDELIRQSERDFWNSYRNQRGWLN